MSQDTGAARLPGIPVLRTTDPALARWAQAVAEHLEVRSGTRGNPLERAVTVRELLGATTELQRGSRTPTTLQAGEIAIDLGGGRYAAISVNQFAESLRSTKLYKDLVLRLDDTARFDEVPEAVRNILLNSIADEAAKRGASVSHVENVLQTTTDSLSMRIDELTASVDGAASGVRELAFAAASTATASAGKITQVEARLDDVGGVTIEESMIATADRVDGLAGEYMVKINAGGAVAGFGLAASEDPLGNTESSFIVQADTFALTSSYTFAQEATPTATVIGQTWYTPSTKVSKRATATGTGSWVVFTPAVPFGVDTVTGTTYINGNLRIGSPSGEAIGGITSGTDGSDGSPGTRGTVSRYLTGTSWSDATANASLPGGTPMTGDLVSIGSGSFISTRTYSAGVWSEPGVIIKGSLIATGSITSSAMFANTFSGYTFTGSVFQTAASGARIVMSYTDNTINIYSDSGLTGKIYGSATDGVFFGTANSTTVAPLRAYQTGSFPAVHGVNTDTIGTAIAGMATGAGTLNYGGNFGSTNGVGLSATGGSRAIVASGKIYQSNGGTSGQWNNYTNSVLPVADNAFYSGYTGNVWAGIYSQTAVVVTSDARKKTDIENCDLGLAFIDSLRPVTYRMLEGHQEATFAPGESALTKDANDEYIKPTITVRPGTRRHYGLLAQEVKAAIGDLDCGFWTIEDVSDADSAQGLRYEELIAPMIKAIQQLSARVAQLENQP